MVNYLVVLIAGRQYIVTPDSRIEVDNLGDVKNFECDKVLLKASGDILELGNPYLKVSGGASPYKVKFEVSEPKRLRKIRVATYKAKANTRKVRGSRRIVSYIKMVA